MAKLLIAVALSFVALLQITRIVPAQGLDPAAQRGLAFVKANCSRCHSIDKLSASPLAAAPPFRTLHTKYPLENLEEAMAEGIVTGHPAMPEFRLDPGQIHDVLAYFRTLER